MDISSPRYAGSRPFPGNNYFFTCRTEHIFVFDDLGYAHIFFTSSAEHIFGAKNGGRFMKGYLTATGYMGYVDGRFVLFANETDYREYIDEQD